MPFGDIRSRLRPRTRAREFAAQRRTELLAARYARWREQPLVQDAVLYESFFGNGMLDHPEAVFRHLLGLPEFAHLRHIWVLDRLADHPEVTAEFADDDRVRFVELESGAYLEALATSRYLVNNSTFPQVFAKRPGQVYLNTWHGVPLKHMGFDLPDGGIISRNIVRNFLNADYLLSANDYMTRTMYRDAYRLQGIYRGAVIEEGQPRVDRQLQAEHDPASVVRRLEEHGARVAGRRIVLFAPTWRGDSFQDPQANAAQLVSAVRKLQAALGTDEHVVLLKVHQAVYRAVRDRVGNAEFLVSNEIPTNLVLAATDLLVTDYSSVFFDFLVSGRPLVHFVPDLDEYVDGRGLYLDAAELPGPTCGTIPELVELVAKGLEEAVPVARTVQAAEVYCPKDDGAATERVVDIVFRGADESAYTVHRDFGTDKQRLMVYLGGMKSMGITTSALNLLRNLDYDRFDVTAYWVHGRGQDRVKNARLIDPRVRVIPRAAVLNGSPWRVRAEQRRMLRTGLEEKLSARHVSFWTDEWRRMFGDATFDHLVDFSGYGCFAPFLFSVADAKHKSIWLHNDMMADMQRETVGEKHLEQRLMAVFSTYRHFDHLVSVSPTLNTVNREKLAAYAPPERFTFAHNTIDGARVLQMGSMTKERALAKAAGTPLPETEPGAGVFDTTNVASAVASLLQHFDSEDVLREVRSRHRLSRGAETGPGTITFVTVGRLSPEKNHARLIKAFAQVHEEHPEIRLVIIGGGKLEGELTRLLTSLGLEPYVTLAGQVDNPFALMAAADCFVLSSDYEGQPMVILEARTLGLPVVTTAFASVGDSVPEDAGLVVPQTVKGVANGLRRFLAGKVPAHALDGEEYNRQAVEEFVAAIGAD
jgi:CDP-glycerol glycerophosphotransferase (TagB/SpsB family)/glycosyltransferase involved in cell wall biosynthesis